MKKILIVALLFLITTAIIVSCKKNDETKSANNNFLSMFHAPTSSSPLNNSTLRAKIISTYSIVPIQGKLKNMISSTHSLNGVSIPTTMAMRNTVLDMDGDISYISFDNPTPYVQSYDGTDIQAVFFPQQSSNPNITVSFVTFERNGLMGDMAMFVGIEQISATVNRAYYYDLDGNVVAQFDGDTNGNISNIVTYPSIPPSTDKIGWWGRWASCVVDGFTSFLDKTRPANVALGLACAYFAGPCVAGAVLGCAAAATF